MDEPVTLDRVFSPDRSRVAAWTVASCELTPDEKSLLYEVSVTETATGRQIAHLTRRWTRDRHTNAESGSLLSSVAFGASGALLVLHYEDGSREAVPLRPAQDELDAGTISLFAAAAPCSICGSASWTNEVCPSCALYCERLMASGGFQHRARGPETLEREHAATPKGEQARKEPCDVCRVLEETCAVCRRRNPTPTTAL